MLDGRGDYVSYMYRRETLNMLDGEEGETKGEIERAQYIGKVTERKTGGKR
jgi:hypothetical protein